MKYMLLMNQGGPDDGCARTDWTPEDLQASWQHMLGIHRELTETGELLYTEGLTGPEAAKRVVHDGTGAPAVTDGPFAESKELLAGFWMVEVESEARALEIAARTSMAPGPGGRPTARPVEVRPVTSAPDPMP